MPKRVRMRDCEYDIIQAFQQVWGIMGVDANHQSICVSAKAEQGHCD